MASLTSRATRRSTAREYRRVWCFTVDLVTTHHVDADEPDEHGGCHYYYEYDVYGFSEGDVTLMARAYVDSADEAHFLSVTLCGKRRLLRDADLETPLFLEAVAYLRNVGKHKLTWLSGRGNGYEPVVM